MILIESTLILTGIVGHAVFWVAVVNRAHSWAIPRWLIKTVTVIAGVTGGLIGLLVGADYLIWGWTTHPVSAPRAASLVYLVACSALAIWAVASHVLWWRRGRPPEALVGNHTTVVDIADAVGHRPLGPGYPSLAGHLPGNEVLRLSIQHKTLKLPRLAPEHNGLRIAHLSDLHISGRIGRPYFEEVVARTNAWRPDIIAITGDLLDRNHCLEWGVETLAALSAPYGVYFIFGNHDLLVDHRRLKQMLVDAGLCYLGSMWQQIDPRGQPLILAGNELPWFPPAADATSLPPRDAAGQPVRILLAHAPDQLEWAVTADFDLMLAGHTHGGQIRFPLLGAVASPSRYGTRYAAGTFARGGLLMHVSRGTASLAPLRWNCPPELALIELCRCRGASL